MPWVAYWNFHSDEWSAATQKSKFYCRSAWAHAIAAASVGGHLRLYSDLHHAVLIAVLRSTASKPLPPDPLTEWATDYASK
jgi:hypothetical protein